MLGIFSSAFMTATRMDGFALVASPSAAPQPVKAPAPRRLRATLWRLVGIGTRWAVCPGGAAQAVAARTSAL